MKEPVTQTLLPVVVKTTEHSISVKGVVPIPSTTFDGTETEITLPSGAVCPIEVVVVDPTYTVKVPEYMAIVFGEDNDLDGTKYEQWRSVPGILLPKPPYYDVHTGDVTEDIVVKSLREGLSPSDFYPNPSSEVEVQDSDYTWSITNAMFNIRANTRLQLNWVNALVSSLGQDIDNSVKALHIVPISVPAGFSANVSGTGNTYNGTVINDLLEITLTDTTLPAGTYGFVFQIVASNVKKQVSLQIQMS